MRVLVYFGHPSQYLFLRETIKQLLSDKNEVKILIKSKDVLETLVRSDNLDYINIQDTVRGNNKFSIIKSLIKRNISLYKITTAFKPDIMVGTDASIAHIGFLKKIKRVTILEDDYDVIKGLAILTYPFTNAIICPNVCDVGRWKHKKIGYNGYMKLGYLHPKYFTKNFNQISQYDLNSKYVLLRLSNLKAHHDTGIGGISDKFLKSIISIILLKGYKVKISSERDLDQSLHKYFLKIDPVDMHQVLVHSSLLISDSQSMSVEASVLGVPSVRVSDFHEKISVLQELENNYQLTYSYKPIDTNAIENKIEELLSSPNILEKFQVKRKKMLKEKIDVTHFMVNYLSQSS